MPDGPLKRDKPYVIAFVDRSTRPETEVWLYASWESEPPSDNHDEKTFDRAEMLLLQSLLATFASLPLPPSIHTELLAEQSDESCDRIGEAGLDHLGLSIYDYSGHGSDPHIMLWGAVHEKTYARIDALGVLSSKWQSCREPNYTFMFLIADLPAIRGLPEGMHWGEVQRKHFALIKSRTQIARQDRTLAVLPSVAVYLKGKEEPIAWAFVGLDGSETTLHVEKEFRGKGLAKAVATKLFSEKMDRFFEDDKARGVTRMAHANVINGNEQSVGVCKSVGGRSDWNVYWLRIDLEKVASAL
ncbi:hypothetical protein K431DRAFT_304729 [Polychaeton citri CBS 116435]|uniref:FR47-like domain-containing protein n=1 Tax=Polychaeton citri CBS 116435 TaxID=1314669 RepID=A0A9P4UPD8_9PEZI|nr:hypothetical protein K431DRAFT_304729 [Polychaeton citri CBS 116435]